MNCNTLIVAGLVSAMLGACSNHACRTVATPKDSGYMSVSRQPYYQDPSIESGRVVGRFSNVTASTALFFLDQQAFEIECRHKEWTFTRPLELSSHVPRGIPTIQGLESFKRLAPGESAEIVIALPTRFLGTSKTSGHKILYRLMNNDIDDRADLDVDLYGRYAATKHFWDVEADAQVDVECWTGTMEWVKLGVLQLVRAAPIY